jgi:hypothetical protein
VNRLVDLFRTEGLPIACVKPGTGLHPEGLDERDHALLAAIHRIA